MAFAKSDSVLINHSGEYGTYNVVAQSSLDQFHLRILAHLSGFGHGNVVHPTGFGHGNVADRQTLGSCIVRNDDGDAHLLEL